MLVSEDFCFFQPRHDPSSLARSTLNRKALTAIMNALSQAWDEIQTFQYLNSTPFQLSHFRDEDELSTKLVEILNHRLDTSLSGPFTKKRFQVVVRDAKTSTANLSSIDQMPDMVFRPLTVPQGEDRQASALFVEAKLVDPTPGCRPYVVDGLHRFVSGKYAPRVTFGLMLGYAVSGFDDVSAQLPKYYQRASDPEAVLCKAALSKSTLHDRCFESTHTRSHPCPPNFRALHFWLARPTPVPLKQTVGVPQAKRKTTAAAKTKAKSG